MAQETYTSEEFQRRFVPEHARKRSWSNATPTACDCGRKHASKMEARVCARLRREIDANILDALTLYQQVRFPLFSLAPNEKGAPHTITVDFVVCSGSHLFRAIDAKAKGRVSRDWRRGAAAFEATYGIRIEECDK